MDITYRKSFEVSGDRLKQLYKERRAFEADRWSGPAQVRYMTHADGWVMAKRISAEDCERPPPKSLVLLSFYRHAATKPIGTERQNRAGIGSETRVKSGESVPAMFAAGKKICRRRGRPRTGHDVAILLRISRAQADAIDALAAAQRMTRQDVIRAAIAAYGERCGREAGSAAPSQGSD